MKVSQETRVKRYNSDLTGEEKAEIMKSIFFNEKDPEKYIRDPQTYLENQFTKLNGFDFRWSSLITSTPLLFEDIDYLRVRSFIDSTITPEEIEAYKRGDCRELYATFENMLVCNLKHYDRIISFCTMMFMHYIRIDGDVITDQMDDIPLIISMTPTEIWCAALASTNSSEWEINHGWSFTNEKLTTLPIKDSNKSVLELSWDKLYNKNIYFKRFVEFSALRCHTSGFRQTMIKDITSNVKLSQVCQKFTRASLAITDQQLQTLWDYITETECVNKRLYFAIDKCLSAMFSDDKSQYAVYVYHNEFYIHTSKFSMRVRKNNGALTKDYLANSFECFTAEKYLVDTINDQIEWAKYEIPTQYQYDINILSSLLNNMLDVNYHEVICLKRMNDYGVLSKITFTGVFANVYVKEEFMLDNRVIKVTQKCLSKYNAAKYIINRGYYLFGKNEDVYKFMADENVTQDSIIDHYTNYAIPIMQYMYDIIAQNEMYKNEIIDIVMCGGNIDEQRFNNKNIKYTSLIKLEAREIMSDIIIKQNKNITNKKSYWRVINDER